MEIRKATYSDAGHIANIMKSVWPEQIPDIEKIRIPLARDERQSFVVEFGDLIVGFVDCFMTTAADGCKRFELDLMAVLPSFQGQGIGKQLVEAATHAAEQQTADIIRALVQTDNVASFTALERRDFATDNSVYVLNVSSTELTATKPATQSLYIVAVNTFSYTGLWLENDFSEEALAPPN